MRIIFKNEKKKDTNNISIFSSGGFVAVFLVMSVMIMILLGSLGAFSAASSYEDTVSRREHRMQATLNAKSCVSVAILAFAHDYFYAAKNQSVPDFSCTIISAGRSGQSIFISASGYEDDVTEHVSATAIDNGRSIDLVTEENL
jgi:hypothetical protein